MQLMPWDAGGARAVIAWWTARLTELIPTSLLGTAIHLRRSIIVDASNPTRFHNARQEPIDTDLATKRARRWQVLLRPRPESVLVKQIIVPPASHRETGHILNHQLARITPFHPEALFWRWDRKSSANRDTVTLTMVPKPALAEALNTLHGLGIQVDAIVTGPADRPCLLPVQSGPGQSSKSAIVNGLLCVCVCLGIVVLALPFALRALELRKIDAAMTELRPAMTEVTALQKTIAAAWARRNVVARESAQVGDALRILSTVAQILPDDTFLTELSLRGRKITLTGRSAGAPHLVSLLSADPSIQDVVFAAPVTHAEGSSFDLFSIQAGIIEQ